ncbi:adenylyl-sulfate kinase [Cryptosporangium minutisporangium]|uniref:Adenylyl-sulfate kinase n=1 Tax=Cryptosporangium minutisporangium TaxID=113569 RepID=A0ABP6T990_9ACTN
MSRAPRTLRIATAGSVDDGKSTLVGRLLYDSKSTFTDQLAAVEQASRDRGEELNLALLTDGLRAEREQGITIDVAYRYFATPKRSFVVADTPGHVQYTRNMVTGASNADLALILVDAEKGLTEQSRRHAFLASLLGVPHVVLCVNKMDLVGFSAERFDEISADFERFAARLDVHDLSVIPVAALHGDNVVHRSVNMPWYEGLPLLHHLEQVHVASDRNLIDVRFPVQYVIRSGDFRGYSGTLGGGVMRAGDEVVALPSGFATTVRAIWAPGGIRLEEAFAPQAVTLELADDLDVGRGDLLCRPGNRPHVGSDLDAMLCWFAERSALTVGGRYVLRHTTLQTRAQVSALEYRLDVNTLHRDPAATDLRLNQIGRVRLHTQQPLAFDPYRRNRATGGFILVDEVTNETVAAGMLTGPAAPPLPASSAAVPARSPSVTSPTVTTSPAVTWHASGVTRAERESRGATVWLTGLPASGKSSVAVELERRLVAAGRPAYLLDGDNLRHGLCADLGFTPADRAENVRRVGEVARLFADAGTVAVVSLVSPYRADRDAVRAGHRAAGLPFVEVFVDTPVDVCAARDPKGLYARGEPGLTGVDAPYEPPESPDLVLRPSDGDPTTMAALVAALLVTPPSGLPE